MFFKEYLFLLKPLEAMSISIYLASIKSGKELIVKLLKEEFGINDNTSIMLYDNVKMHFDKLKDNIYLLAETNYVDKVYRDSYYHYYSSKMIKYKRDCIRISFFDGKVSEADFQDKVQIKNLQKSIWVLLLFDQLNHKLLVEVLSHLKP